MDPRPPLDPVAERAVALTDLALGIEAAVLSIALARHPRGRGRGLRDPLVASLAATSVAALAGAGLHGLTTDRADLRRRAMWRASLTSIGVAALSSWSLGARLALPSGTARTLERVAAVGHLPYLAAVVSGDRPYRLAVGAYLPGSAFLGAALGSRLGGDERGAATLGLAGMGVTYAAAGVQVRHIGLGRRFDHNALYHALQAVGIALLYAAGRRLLAADERSV